MSDKLQIIGETRPHLEGARYYDASKNPGTARYPAALPGVPLRDLSAEEFEAFPTWLQYSIDASPMYRKTKPRETAPPAEE